MARELAAAIEKGGGLVTAEDLAQYEVKEAAADSWHLSRIRDHQRSTTVVRWCHSGGEPQHP